MGLGRVYLPCFCAFPRSQTLAFVHILSKNLFGVTLSFLSASVPDAYIMSF